MWSYNRDKKDTGFVREEEQYRVTWVNSLSIRELEPTQAGFIRLRVSLKTDFYRSWWQGEINVRHEPCRDCLRLDGEELEIRASSAPGYSYDREIQVPISWARKTIQADIAWERLELRLDVSTVAASQVFAGDGTFGQEIPIWLARVSGDVRHSLWVLCLGQRETLLDHSSAVTAKWRPSVETYAPLLTDGLSTTAEIYCESFVGEFSMGIKSKRIQLAFDPLDLAPELESGWFSLQLLNEGPVEGMSVWVSGYSRAEIRFDQSKIRLKYGASIAGFSVSAAGEQITQAPYRTPVLREPVRIACVVTDSRGCAAGMIASRTMLSYSPPALSQIRGFRCDSQGNPDEEGEYCGAGAVLSYSSLNTQNPCGLWASLKGPGDRDFGQETALRSGELTILPGLDPTRSYELRLRAEDRMGQGLSVTRKLVPPIWAMRFREDGQGVGFGMTPTRGGALELPGSWKILIGGRELWEILWPVGSVYLSADNSSPADHFGGSWQALELGISGIRAWKRTEDNNGSNQNHG